VLGAGVAASPSTVSPSTASPPTVSRRARCGRRRFSVHRLSAHRVSAHRLSTHRVAMKCRAPSLGTLGAGVAASPYAVCYEMPRATSPLTAAPRTASPPVVSRRAWCGRRRLSVRRLSAHRVSAHCLSACLVRASPLLRTPSVRAPRLPPLSLGALGAIFLTGCLRGQGVSIPIEPSSGSRRLILRLDQSGLTSDSLGEAERGRWPTRGYDGHMAGTSMAARPPSVVLAYRCSGQKGNLPVEG
jgi:hypothetical protein